jgi:hypothetical protein
MSAKQDSDDGPGQADDDADQSGSRRVADVYLTVGLSLDESVEPVRHVTPSFGHIPRPAICSMPALHNEDDVYGNRQGGT